MINSTLGENNYNMADGTLDKKKFRYVRKSLVKKVS